MIPIYANPVEETPVKAVDESAVIPLEIEFGHSLPEGLSATVSCANFGQDFWTLILNELLENKIVNTGL